MHFICTGQPIKLGVSAWHERNENDVFLAFGLGMILLKTAKEMSYA